MQAEGNPFQLYEFQTSVRADSCTSLELMVVLLVDEMIDRVDRGHHSPRRPLAWKKSLMYELYLIDLVHEVGMRMVDTLDHIL